MNELFTAKLKCYMRVQALLSGSGGRSIREYLF
jgi:hypothetical protein